MSSPLGASEAIDVPIETAFSVRRFSVAEYEMIGQAGILTEDDSVELLEGLIVEKMTKNPRHDGTIDVLAEFLWRLLPAGWYPRTQNVLVTSDSAPEPDVVVARGQTRDYLNRDPTASDAALVIEVAEASLNRDRRKRRIYARAGISNYWIIDLISSKIELFAQPNPATAEYMQKEIVELGAAVTFTLPEGKLVTLPLDTAFGSS